MEAVPSRGGGVGGVITPGARAQKRAAKNSVVGDISYIMIIITDLPLGPSKKTVLVTIK